ncbi:MAG: hypothetical protein ACK55I_31590, partial [bacterium]
AVAVTVGVRHAAAALAGGLLGGVVRAQVDAVVGTVTVRVGAVRAAGDVDTGEGDLRRGAGLEQVDGDRARSGRARRTEAEVVRRAPAKGVGVRVLREGLGCPRDAGARVQGVGPVGADVRLARVVVDVLELDAGGTRARAERDRDGLGTAVAGHGEQHVLVV